MFKFYLRQIMSKVVERFYLPIFDTSVILKPGSDDMLTYDEQEKMERLMAKDENFHELITAMKKDYHLTLSQR